MIKWNIDAQNINVKCRKNKLNNTYSCSFQWKESWNYINIFSSVTEFKSYAGAISVLLSIESFNG